MKSLFRTFLSPYIGVAYLLFAGSFIVVSGRWDFLGDSYLTLETLSNFNIYTLPLLAAFVSYDTASLCRPGSLHMIAATPRWKAALLLPSIIATASITTTHIIMTLTMLMWGQVTNPMVGWERIALTLTLQILTFLAVALIGATIGRHTPPHTAGFIAFAALFLLALTSESFPGGTPWLVLQGATAPQVGYVWTWQGQLLRLIQVFLITAAAAYTITARKTPASEQGPSKLAPIAILAATTLTGFALPTTTYKTPLTTTLERSACSHYILSTNDPLEICLTYEHRRAIHYVADSYVEAYERMISAGVDPLLLPSRLEEETAVPSPHEGKEGVAYLGIPALGPFVPQADLSHDPDFQMLIANTVSVPAQCYNDTFNTLVGGQDMSFLNHWDITFGFATAALALTPTPFTTDEYADSLHAMADACSQ